MSSLRLAVLLAGILMASADPPRADLARLQGWWESTSQIYDGGDGVPPSVLRSHLVLIEDEVMKEALDDGAIALTRFWLNPGKDPGWIDQRPDHGDEAGKRQPGIYCIEGDRLTICFAFAGQRRPTEFRSKPGSKWVLVAFQRKHLSRQDAERMARSFADGAKQQSDARTRAKLAILKDARPRTTLTGHQSTVWDLAFSPDGTLLASAGDGGDTVRLWNVSTGKLERLFRPGLSEGYPVHIAFAPDGKTLAIGGLNRKEYDKRDGQLPRTVLRLWGTKSGKDRLLVAATDYPSNIHSLAYSRDGKTLVVNNGRRLYLWDVTGEKVHVALDVPADTRISDLNTMQFMQAAMSPNGQILAAGGHDRHVRLYEQSTGRPLARLQGHEGGVNSIAFTPDGSRLASGAGDMTVRIWNVAENLARKQPARPEKVLRHHDAIGDVAFSADGTILAAAGMGGVVTIYDARIWTLKTSFDTGQEECFKCAFSPDGSLLATCGAPPEIRVWDVADLLKETPR